jgi:F-type H+-transporting ATPase subunit delta
MSEYRVASRYAKSLIELAKERGVLEQVKGDIVMFKEAADGSRDLAVMLKSPIVSHHTKAVILRKIFGGKVHEMTSLFFDIVCRKNRESVLRSVAEAFLHQYNEVKGIQRAKVVSAVPLTSDARAKLEQVIASMSGKTVELSESVDESLIGGYVLTVGDRQIDDSVKGRLEGLKSALMQ